MIVVRIGGHPEVTTRVELLHPAEELDVHRHQVLAPAVPDTVLHHVDLSIALDDPGLDLSRLSVDQDLPVALPGQDPLAHLLDALRAERVRLAREAELRERALVALQKRRRSPLRLEDPVRQAAIDRLERVPRDVRHPLQTGAHDDRWAEVAREAIRPPRRMALRAGGWHGPDSRSLRSDPDLLLVPGHSLAHGHSSSRIVMLLLCSILRRPALLRPRRFDAKVLCPASPPARRPSPCPGNCELPADPAAFAHWRCRC